MKIGNHHENLKAFTEGLAYKNFHDFAKVPSNCRFIDRIGTEGPSRKNLRCGSLLLGNILGGIMVLPLMIFAFRGLFHMTKAGLDRFLGFFRSLRSSPGTPGQSDSTGADSSARGIEVQTFAKQQLPANKFQYFGIEILCNSNRDCPLFQADAYVVGTANGIGKQLHSMACCPGEEPKETQTTTLNHLVVSPKSSLGRVCGVKHLLTVSSPSREFPSINDPETVYKAACNEALSKLNMREIESLVFSNFDGAIFGLNDNKKAGEIFMDALKKYLQNFPKMAGAPKLKSIVINHQDGDFMGVCRRRLRSIARGQ